MRIEDFPAPSTAAADAARELAGDHHSAALLHHVHRSWLWAEAFAALEHRTGVDRELLYVAALLHDIGLVEDFDNVGSSYEAAGAEIAVVLTAGARWSPFRRSHVRDVIIGHNRASSDPETDLEGYLLESATAFDITGRRTADLPSEFVAEVLHAHPRGDLRNEFASLVLDQADRKPTTAAARLAREGLAQNLARHPLENL